MRYYSSAKYSDPLLLSNVEKQKQTVCGAFKGFIVIA